MGPPRSWSFYAPSYLRILATFRNGPAIVWAHHHRRDCDSAILWSGSSIENFPNGPGFVNTVVEIWGAEAYTAPGFYRPKNGDVVLDLGANLGLFARWVLHLAPRARVWAFEPFPENLGLLRQNVAPFGDSVCVHPFAVGGQNGESTMRNCGESISHQLGGAADGPKVRVITLAEAVDLTHASHIDFLKMDIEGSERDIFEQSAQPELLKRIRHLVVEYHDNLRPGTLQLLRERLAQTHREVSLDQSAEGYGLIRATLRAE